VIVPALKKVPFSELAKESGLSRSALFDVLAGRSRPHRANREKLAAIARRLVSIDGPLDGASDRYPRRA